MLKCYKEFRWFSCKIFSLLSENIIFGTKVQFFFRWFHVVPDVFGSIMLKCYKEFRWFPVKISSLLSAINYFQSDRNIARCSLFYLFLFMTLRHLRSSRTVVIFMHI